MEIAKTRWRVTYTKHIKQKRKVYADGCLDIHLSTNKMKLYDECEKLLECKILKKDEVVNSGETLTFNGYLVDVGDPEGDCKPVPDLISQGRDKRSSEQQLRNNYVASGDEKTGVKKKKAQMNCISPSQKLIGELKKRELHKYRTQGSSPETTKSETKEWQVLYTSQVTQKAKKYHDGFLRLLACGYLGRQIMLFDETRKLLDSRFLRRDEVIGSGESIAFDGHLVEICELEPSADLKVKNSCNIAGKLAEMQRQPNCNKNNKFTIQSSLDVASQNSPVTMESNVTEWQVMYTPHVTQRTKKYHDGFLRIAGSGSLQRQAKLYDEGRKLLNSRFLRKGEIIRSGEPIAFDSHLVDIGVPKEVQTDLKIEGENHNMFQKAGTMHKQQNHLKSGASQKPQSEAASRDIANATCSISAVQGIKLHKEVLTNKPLRDAIQILSILQKPTDVKSNDAGSSGNSMMGKLPSSKGLKSSDAVVAVVTDNNQESYRNEDIGRANEAADCPDLMPSTSLAAMSSGPGEDRIIPEEAKSACKSDELPSFDLGF